jgi:hypothetical protein
MIKILSVLFLCASIAQAQYSLPFLTFTPSAEANGAGGIMSSVVSSSPSSMIFNPAQLGSISRHTTFSSEFYTPVSQLPLRFGISVDPSMYDSYSILFGTTYGSLSFGFGYSRIVMDWGKWNLTNASNPSDRQTFHIYETSDNLSIGTGFRWGKMHGAFGITLKLITSRLPGTSSAGLLKESIAEPSAADIGMLFTFPLVEYFHANEQSSSAPFVDLTIAYAVNNIGSDVRYEGAPQYDPLPELARLGGSITAGYRSLIHGRSYTLFSVMMAREAEEYMFHRSIFGASDHKYYPVQEMNPIASIFEGRYVNHIPVRKGFSVSLLETVTILSGMYQPTEMGRISTSGVSISSNGIFTLLHSMLPAGAHPTAASILSSVELRFNRSQFSGVPFVFTKGTYTSMVISLHH